MPTMNNGEMPSADLESSSPVMPAQELDAPSHELETPVPEIEKPGEADSDVNIPIVPKSGIKVVATRKGFYNQSRIKEGHEFVIKDFSKIGDWMKCLDPVLERKRLSYYKKKKAKS